MGDDSSVRVAVRIRPQSAREVFDVCRVCTTVTPGEPQVVLGEDKAFTYDYVFDVESQQQEIYNVCVRHLIEGCLQGYNATVLAYGQTGSGKTYTMGTGFETEVDVSRDEKVGILPRAVHHLFTGIEELRKTSLDQNRVPPKFSVQVQFLELYNEELIDLLEPTPRGQKSGMRIHEDPTGGIYIAGVTSRSVGSGDEALKCLRLGALARTTAATQMNAQSSRSHAIFTLHIRQQRLAPTQKSEENDYEELDGNMGTELETLSAKLHFVDLAGSERLKRTGATGDRAKEGISINCGLLALGNVISALGDVARKAQHVPYRDSKLTRLLQDSLGGNSRTLMIACISPSDRDFMETLSTLKYAHRARNIKNRVVLNQDRSSKTIALLRQEIIKLQQEVAEYKQGKRVVGEDGSEVLNDMFHENHLMQAENQTLRTRVKALQDTVDNLTLRNTELQAQKAAASWINSDSEADVTTLVQNYIVEIEEMRARLFESENTCSQLRKVIAAVNKSPGRSSVSSGLLNPTCTTNVNELIEQARRNLQKDLTMLQKNQLLQDASGEAGGSTVGNEAGSSAVQAESSSPDESEESSSSSDDEDEGENAENARYSLELAELTSEITVKQKLIEELELSQRRLDVMKQHYEDKLNQLQERIKATQEERDKILASYTRGGSGASGSGSQMDEKVKRVREDYERKITGLTSELKRLQAAQKEHTKLLRSQSEAERQLKTLKSDLTEMKKVKVKLMQKMKEEAAQRKGLELKHSKELAQLRKDSRRRENEIRTLQAEKQIKETVLKRKQEELMALRKMARTTMSEQAAGRVPAKRRNAQQASRGFSPKVAKQKWQRLGNNLARIASNKIAVAQLEKQLERMIEERDNVGRSLSAALRQRDRALATGKEESYIREIDEQIESYQANIDYIQENMAECQRNIVLIEETKGESGESEADSMAQVADLEEARYLISKLVGMCLDQTVLVAQKDMNIRDLQSQLKQVSELDALHQQLLQHVLANSDMELYNILASAGVSQGLGEQLAGSSQSSRSASPVESVSSAQRGSIGTKARRRTFATPDELLYSTMSLDTAGVAPSVTIKEEDEGNPYVNSPRRVTKSDLSEQQSTGNLSAQPGAAAAAASLSSLIPPPASPRLPRKAANTSASNLSVKHNLDLSEGSNSAPASPPTFRRTISREENPNVFSRLTSGTNVGCEPVPNRGTISPFQGKLSNRSPLICTHVAEGHCQAVLSLCATNTLLFSGSKDRTVKVWDLTTCSELQSLSRHSNSVVAVKYCAESNLAFTASSYYVKVWDLRQSPANCVKTLHSSGYSSNGSYTTGMRSLQLPAGESLINDIVTSTINSNLLYAAAGNQVRIWDLRKMSSTGKLSGGHQAAVMRLVAGPIVSHDHHSGEYVITGSKDHYVKVFEVRDSAATGALTPKFNLDPPHYDGIQCLALYQNTLVSGSRDACIKVWDLQLGEQVLSFSNAHRDWICGLAHLPDVRVVLSGCRGGIVRLWATDSWDSLGEIRAHSAPINAIAANASNIFTASSDNNVNMWRLRSNVDISPEPSDQF